MSLGTRFTGQLDQSFRRAVGQLRSIIKEVASLQGKVAGTARGNTLAREMDKVSASTTKARKGMSGMHADVAGVLSVTERLSRAFKVVASYGIVGTGVYAFINSLKTGTQEIVDFDQALKNLQAISGATDAQIATMRDTIEEIARTTKFSTVEVAEGMVLLTQSGLSAEEAMNAMQATADLATGTLSSMQLTTDLMTTTLRAFGLESIEAGRVADVMANAINKSKLTIDKLRISFNFVAAAAAQTGLSIEQAAASMMVLANNGMRASTIGTGLRQVLARLMAPTSKLRDAFTSHGIAIKDVNPRLVGYETALKNLIPTIWDHTRGTVDMGKAYELFGLRGAQAAAVLVKSFMGGNFQKALKYVFEVGTAEAMAAKQAEGLGVKLKNLADRAKLVALAFGEAGVAGALGAIIDLMRGVADMAATLAKTVGGQLVFQFAAWTLSIYGTVKALSILLPLLSKSTLITSIGVFTLELQAAAKSAGGLTAVMAVLGNAIKAHPFLAIAAAVGAVVTTITYFAGATERAIEKSEKLIVENDRIIKSLEVYDGALKNLNERMETAQKENKDTSVVALEYASVIKRLLHDHPELADKLDLTTASYKEMAEAMREVTLARQKDTLQQEIALLTNLTKQREKHTRALEDEGDLWGTSFKSDEAEAKEVALLKGKVEGIKTDIEATIQSTILSLRGLAASGMPMDNILAMFDNLPDEIKNRLKNFSSISSEIKKTGEDLTGALNKVIETMTPVVKKFFDSLAPVDKVDFLSKFKAFQSSMNSFKKNMEELGKGDSPEIDVAVKIKEEEFLKDFQDDLTKKQEDALKKIRELKEENEELDVKALEIAGYKIEAIKLEIEQVRRRNELEERPVEIKKNNNEIARLHKELQDELTKELTDSLKDRLATTKKYSDDYTVIMEVMFENEIISLQEMENYYDKKAEHDVKVAKKAYDRKLITAEEYLAKLKILMERGGITDSEFKDIETRETGGYFDRFLLGVKTAQEEATTLGDVFEEIGHEFDDQFASGLTDGVWDFIDGTKSAKEAWNDFAQDMFGWLTKLILKQLILNALQDAESGAKSGLGILSSIGGLFGSGSTAVAGAGDVLYGAGTMFHSGGVVGVDKAPITFMPIPSSSDNIPSFHSGLRSDEFLAKLQKKETVFTEGQMDKLGTLFRSSNEGGKDETQGTYNLFNIQAVDAQSFVEMAHRNPQAIIGPLIEGLQQGGQQLRNTIRSII